MGEAGRKPWPMRPLQGSNVLYASENPPCCSDSTHERQEDQAHCPSARKGRAFELGVGADARVSARA